MYYNKSMKAFYVRTHVHSRIVTYDIQYYRRRYWMSFQGDEEHENWGFRQCLKMKRNIEIRYIDQHMFQIRVVFDSFKSNLVNFGNVRLKRFSHSILKVNGLGKTKLHSEIENSMGYILEVVNLDVLLFLSVVNTYYSNRSANLNASSLSGSLSQRKSSRGGK